MHYVRASNTIVGRAVYFVPLPSEVVSPIQRSSATVSAFKSFKAPDYALGFKWL